MKLLEKFYEPVTKRSTGEQFLAAIALTSLTMNWDYGTPYRRFTLTADREIRLDYGEVIERSNGELLRVISNADDFKTPQGSGLSLGKAICVKD